MILAKVLSGAFCLVLVAAAGASAAASARIGALTFICSKGDVHPTDAGYRAMAAAFLTASGYAKSS